MEVDKVEKNQGGQDRVDQTAGGATEAEDGEDQEGDDAAERQARRPESQRCEDDLFMKQEESNMWGLTSFQQST